jgi:hypothetical protein
MRQYEEAYRCYRRAGKDLHHKIMEATLEGAAIDYVAEKLGLGKGRRLILDTEDDLSVLMEFALYEYRSNGKNAIERYRGEIGGSGQIEAELLEAMVQASTSLFRVEGASWESYSLQLRDLIAESSPLTLVDINFSQTLALGLILFIRPIRLKDFSMTSGIGFIFPGNLEKYLQRQWQRLGRRKSESEASAERYAGFFKLNKRMGLPTRYEQV